MRAGSALAALLLAGPALAQQPGWHYSPLPGEGDRAALGCSRSSTAEDFTCLAVRCEDDFGVGLHIHTSRKEGDVGTWQLTFDREFPHPVVTEPSGSPYGARVTGDVAEAIAALKDGTVAYLDPPTGTLADRAIPLAGSLYAINRALYFCAPRVEPQPG